MEQGAVVQDGAVHIAEKLGIDDFFEMASLERRFYGDEFITPPEEAWEWYRAFPGSVVAAKDLQTGRVAGFVNLFPVRREVGDALLAGTFNDAALTVADIAGAGVPATLFFCCAAMDEGYRGNGLLRRLVWTALEPYRELAGVVDLVVADTVTGDGACLMERFGFGLVGDSDHGSRVYAQPFPEFVDRVDAAMRSFCVGPAPVGRTRCSL